MRAVELGKVAAAAEALRLRRIVRRQGLRSAYGAVAGVFAIAVLVMLHVVIYMLLRLGVSPVVASLIVFAIDLVVAGALAFMALRNTPDEIEQEALQVRKQAVHEMKRAITVMSIAGEITGLAIRSRTRSKMSGGRRGRAWLIADIASRVMARR